VPIWRVKASNLHATYTAGVYVTDTAQEACEQARDDYRDSPLGRACKDVGAFRFYAVRAELKDGD
jgi:hypothetical protein